MGTTSRVDRLGGLRSQVRRVEAHRGDGKETRRNRTFLNATIGTVEELPRLEQA